MITEVPSEPNSMFSKPWAPVAASKAVLPALVFHIATTFWAVIAAVSPVTEATAAGTDPPVGVGGWYAIATPRKLAGAVAVHEKLSC